MTVCFLLSGNRTFRPTLRASYIHTEILDISTSLLHPHKNFGYLHGSLTPTQKFGIAPRISYIHIEISDFATGLLHSHRNFEFLHGSLTPTRNLGSLPGSLTPTQKFRITPRVSYTHTEFWDISSGLLHPHRNSRYLLGSLTPTQNLSDTTAGFLHPNFRLLTLGD